MDEDGAIMWFLIIFSSVILALFVGCYIGWKAHARYVQAISDRVKYSVSEHEGERRQVKRWTIAEQEDLRKRLKRMEVD